MKIFLDDDPIRDSWVDDTWTIVRTADECIAILRVTKDVEILSLDHDLGEVEGHPIYGNTGYAVLVQLERWASYGEIDFIPKRIEIHSANPVGRKNMMAAIASIKKLSRHEEEWRNSQSTT